VFKTKADPYFGCVSLRLADFRRPDSASTQRRSKSTGSSDTTAETLQEMPMIAATATGREVLTLSDSPGMNVDGDVENVLHGAVQVALHVEPGTAINAWLLSATAHEMNRDVGSD